MIVIDASALLEVLLAKPASPRIQARLFRPGATLHAPHLIDVEVVQVLRRYSAAGELGPERAGEALGIFGALPLARHPHDVFITRIWELRHNVTAYDAAYLALAEALDAPLVTRDAKLAGSAGHRARVELL